jgi:hypothetical protein
MSSSLPWPIGWQSDWASAAFASELVALQLLELRLAASVEASFEEFVES